MLPPHEEPMPVAALVAVVVLDRMDDEARAFAASVLDLAAGQTMPVAWSASTRSITWVPS